MQEVQKAVSPAASGDSAAAAERIYDSDNTAAARAVCATLSSLCPLLFFRFPASVNDLPTHP